MANKVEDDLRDGDGEGGGA